jgi:L-ascorbate metabolism protein UlaG (beta-lactamase superfamily)
MNPEEALLAFHELGAKVMVPMHYGTFRLSYEPMEEPLPRLLVAARQSGLSEKVAVMLEGRPEVF